MTDFASVHTSPHSPSFSRELPPGMLGSDSDQALFSLPGISPYVGESFGPFTNYEKAAPSRHGTYDIYEHRCGRGCKECVCSLYSSAEGKCLRWNCGDREMGAGVEGFGEYYGGGQEGFGSRRHGGCRAGRNQQALFIVLGLVALGVALALITQKKK